MKVLQVLLEIIKAIALGPIIGVVLKIAEPHIVLFPNDNFYDMHDSTPVRSDTSTPSL
jgi:hypothetical protein